MYEVFFENRTAIEVFTKNYYKIYIYVYRAHFLYMFNLNYLHIKLFLKKFKVIKNPFSSFEVFMHSILVELLSILVELNLYAIFKNQNLKISYTKSWLVYYVFYRAWLKVGIKYPAFQRFIVFWYRKTVKSLYMTQHMQNIFIKYIIILNQKNTFYTVNKFLYENKFSKTVKIILKIFLFNLKWIYCSFVLSSAYFLFSLFYLQIELTKQLALWYVVGILCYLLIITFNNFLNKYKYGKFTSAIQRFWKRTSIVFWLVEGFLFVIFFYYFLNSSQEPIYMHDYTSLNQEILIQLDTSYKNMILISLSIYLCYLLLLNVNYLTYYQSLFLLALISYTITYMLYVESYQFVYTVCLFADKLWIFEPSTQIWILECEYNNLRVKQQYFVLCLIAKYWHFIFIFVSWFFFVIKCIEVGKLNYNLLGYNVQNLLILYVLNLFCLIQWVKILFKKFLEIIFYWFYVQYDEKFISNLLNEIFTIVLSLIQVNFEINYFFKDIVIVCKLIFSSDEMHLWRYL